MLAPRDLDYFLEVARRGQLVQAAATLEVTAAALSKGIRRLEQALGLALFERSGQGMRLTPFGQSFVPRAERIRQHHEEALQHAGDVRAGRAGQLRVGGTIAILESVISPALARMQPRRPMMRVTLMIASSDRLLERARDGQLDFAVVPTYEPGANGLEQAALGSDALVPVVRRGHPLLRRRRLRLADVAPLPWLLPPASSAARSRLEAVFAAAGLPAPRAAIEVDANSSWSLSLVRGTDLVAPVPLSSLGTRPDQDVRVLDIEELQIQRTISAFSRPGAAWSPLMQEFVRELAAGKGFARRA
ncbi:MAG: LysR family transcriptional regulator [Burkholderiales bacterium]|nr:LysR family transcriptional regulator [Burkholderiales bacterium]